MLAYTIDYKILETFGKTSDFCKVFRKSQRFNLNFVFTPIHKSNFILTCRYISAPSIQNVMTMSTIDLVSLAEFRSLNPDVRFKKLCLDFTNDNYPTYELYKQ